MNKTELINKLLWLGYTSAEEVTKKRKEAVILAHNLLDEYLEAITVTHCCKSDSDQLFCSECNIDLKKANVFCPIYLECEKIKTK